MPKRSNICAIRDTEVSNTHIAAECVRRSDLSHRSVRVSDFWYLMALRFLKRLTEEEFWKILDLVYGGKPLNLRRKAEAAEAEAEEEISVQKIAETLEKF